MSAFIVNATTWAYVRVVVREVCIDTLVERKGRRIIIQCLVGLGSILYWFAGQASKEFVYVANTLHGTEMVAVSSVVILFEILMPNVSPVGRIPQAWPNLPEGIQSPGTRGA